MLSVRVPQREARLAKSSSSARAVIGELAPGVRIVGVTAGQFSLIDLLEACMEQVDEPADLLVATWTPGPSEMERVHQMLTAHRLRHFRLLVDRSFPGRHPGYVARVTEVCGADSIRITRTHAKFALLSAGDWRIVIRTSMNFNTNPRLEQFDLDDSPELYEFFEGVTELLYENVPAGLSVVSRDVEAGLAAVFADSRESRPAFGATSSLVDALRPQLKAGSASAS